MQEDLSYSWDEYENSFVEIGLFECQEGCQLFDLVDWLKNWLDSESIETDGKRTDPLKVRKHNRKWKGFKIKWTHNFIAKEQFFPCETINWNKIFLQEFMQVLLFEGWLWWQKTVINLKSWSRRERNAHDDW